MLYNRICDITPPLLYNMLHNMTQPSRCKFPVTRTVTMPQNCDTVKIRVMHCQCPALKRRDAGGPRRARSRFGTAGVQVDSTRRT